MTDPIALAQLRHLYQNMVNGAVRDTASAKRMAEGLLALAIEVLERGTPPAVEGEPVAWMGTYDKTDLYYRKPTQADVVPLYTTPQPTQAADSVLEDAERLWEAFIEAWRNEIGVDKIVNIMGGADKLKAVFLDAARKQGGA